MIRNQKGASLVQSMILATLVGLSAAKMASIGSEITKTQQRLDQVKQLEQSANLIRTEFSNYNEQELCHNVLTSIPDAAFSADRGWRLTKAIVNRQLDLSEVGSIKVGEIFFNSLIIDSIYLKKGANFNVGSFGGFLAELDLLIKLKSKENSISQKIFKLTFPIYVESMDQTSFYVSSCKSTESENIKILSNLTYIDAMNEVCDSMSSAYNQELDRCDSGTETVSADNSQAQSPSETNQESVPVDISQTVAVPNGGITTNTNRDFQVSGRDFTPNTADGCELLAPDSGSLLTSCDAAQIENRF